MPRIVDFEGKTYTFPDNASDDDVSSAIQNQADGENLTSAFTAQENIPFYKDVLVIGGGLCLLAVLISILFLRRLAPTKLASFYLIFQKLLILAALLFIFWMFRYEVTPTHPHQCLDRWKGEVVRC